MNEIQVMVKEAMENQPDDINEFCSKAAGLLKRKLEDVVESKAYKEKGKAKIGKPPSAAPGPSGTHSGGPLKKQKTAKEIQIVDLSMGVDDEMLDAMKEASMTEGKDLQFFKWSQPMLLAYDIADDMYPVWPPKDTVTENVETVLKTWYTKFTDLAQKEKTLQAYITVNTNVKVDKV
jgi:hypothetical protein